MIARSLTKFIEEGYGIPKNTPEPDKKQLIVKKITSMGIEDSLVDLIQNLFIFRKRLILFLKIKHKGN